MDSKTAANTAKHYLKQYRDYQFISLRIGVAGDYYQPTKQELQEHDKAVKELQQRSNVVKAVAKIEPADAILLDQRFIKRHRTKKTIEVLADHHYRLTEANFYHRQKRALLNAYRIMKEANLSY